MKAVADPVDAALHEYLRAHASFLYFLLDNDSRIVEANEFALRIIGHNIVGMPFQRVFVEFCNSSGLSGSFVTKENKGKVPLSVKSADGLPRTFYFMLFDLGDARVAFGDQDIDELDKLQKQFLSLNVELGSITRELQKKNAELAQLNAVKNKFLGMAAHDLRNPSGYIKEFSAIMLEHMRDNLTEEQVKILETIHETSGYMSRIVEDLLDVAKIEAGKFDMVFEQFDLRAFLAENISFNNIMAHKKQLEIDCSCDNSVTEIFADKHKLSQVFNNLLSNAIKFSDPGGKIDVQAVNDKAKAVRITVMDSGVGIPADELKNLFKPFVRLSVKATRGEKNTGLGMVIVKNIIEAHGGTIKVESCPGQGTSVSFSIPFRRV